MNREAPTPPVWYSEAWAPEVVQKAGIGPAHPNHPDYPQRNYPDGNPRLVATGVLSGLLEIVK